MKATTIKKYRAFVRLHSILLAALALGCTLLCGAWSISAAAAGDYYHVLVAICGAAFGGIMFADTVGVLPRK